MNKLMDWAYHHFAGADFVARQRAGILLVVDISGFLLSLLVGFYALLYQRLPMTSTDTWTSFAVTAAAAVSGVLLLRGRYKAAAHIAVLIAFTAIWVQVIDKAGYLSAQSDVTYVIAVLALPALLLGRNWALAYCAASILLGVATSVHLAAAHHFAWKDAAGFAIDVAASSAFVVFITVVMGAVYEKAIGRVEALLAEQKECSVAMADLADSLQRSEAHKRVFYRDTIYSVTGGRLSICENSELEPYLTSPDLQVDVFGPGDLYEARREIVRYCNDKGLSGAPLEAFLIGTGEAMTNAVKHANSGRVYAGTTDDSVWIGISDSGPGIESLILPRALLFAGFSTKLSLGLGYTIMLDVSDRILLKTSETGTTVVLIKRIGDLPLESFLQESSSDAHTRRMYD